MTKAIPLPETLRLRYADWQAEIVWRYREQSTTWRLTRDRDVRFVKLVGADAYPSTAGEARRLRWASGRLPVPRVVDEGGEGDVRWLITAGLPGVNGVHHSLTPRPEALVRALAQALLRIHALPVDLCPFDFRLDHALEHVDQRVRAGKVLPGDLHEETGLTSPHEALRELYRTRPWHEDLVVCHGDFCPPNFLFDDHLRLTGIVDLAELGVADRWYDLAIGCWSIAWNLGEDWVEPFLEVYGEPPDPAKERFYGILYDLAS